MGQGEILKALETKNKWMTAKEIANIIGAERHTVGAGLRQMFKYSEVLRREIKGKIKTVEWRAK